MWDSPPEAVPAPEGVPSCFLLIQTDPTDQWDRSDLPHPAPEVPQPCASFHSSSSDPDTDGTLSPAAMFWSSLQEPSHSFRRIYKKFPEEHPLPHAYLSGSHSNALRYCTIFYKGFRKTPILFILIHATNIPVTLRPPDVLPQPCPLAWSPPAPTEYQHCHSHNAGSDAYGNEIQSDRQPLRCSVPD